MVAGREARGRCCTQATGRWWQVVGGAEEAPMYSARCPWLPSSRPPPSVGKADDATTTKLAKIAKRLARPRTRARPINVMDQGRQDAHVAQHDAGHSPALRAEGRGGGGSGGGGDADITTRCWTAARAAKHASQAFLGDGRPLKTQAGSRPERNDETLTAGEPPIFVPPLLLHGWIAMRAPRQDSYCALRRRHTRKLCLSGIVDML